MKQIRHLNLLLQKELLKIILANKLKSYTIEITMPIVQAFRSGRQKHEVHLEEEKKKKQKSRGLSKSNAYCCWYWKTRVTQKQKQKVVEMMEKKVIECVDKAEQNNDTCMSYVIKGNGLKRKSEEIKKEVWDFWKLYLSLFDFVMKDHYNWYIIIILMTEVKQLYVCTCRCPINVRTKWMTRCFQVPNQQLLFQIVKFLMEYNSKVRNHWVC